MTRAKTAGHPEKATISPLVDTTDKSRGRDPSFLAKSVEGRKLRQIQTRQSSVFSRIAETCICRCLCPQINSKTLLSCDLIGDVVHCTDEKVLENCLKAIKGDYQTLLYPILDDLQNHTYSKPSYPQSESQNVAW